MKLIKVKMYDSLKTMDIVESYYDNDRWEWVGLDDNPVCFVCGNIHPFGVLLKDIDDGCMDDVICSQCIDKLKAKLDVLRSSFQKASQDE